MYSPNRGYGTASPPRSGSALLATATRSHGAWSTPMHKKIVNENRIAELTALVRDSSHGGCSA